jgi:hypothetical protein
MSERKPPYTKPELAVVPASNPRAQQLARSALVSCCGVLWSLSPATDHLVGRLEVPTGATMDGRCARCQRDLAKGGPVTTRGPP